MSDVSPATQITKKSYGGGSGSLIGYTVEIRTTASQPEIHANGTVIDREWRRVPYRLTKCDREDHSHFQSGRIGDIPVWNYNHELDNLSLMNFEAAYAIATQTLAQQWNGVCLECRIVGVKVEYSFHAEAESVSNTISLLALKRDTKFTKIEDMV